MFEIPYPRQLDGRQSFWRWRRNLDDLRRLLSQEDFTSAARDLSVHAGSCQRSESESPRRWLL